MAIWAWDPTIAAPLSVESRKSVSMCSMSAASSRSPSWLDFVSAGSSTGWWANTMTLWTESSFFASASAFWSIGSCSHADPRSDPTELASRMNRVPLWSSVRYGRPNSLVKFVRSCWTLSRP